MVGLSSMAPIELPHTGQKARVDQSEERQVLGMPPDPTHWTLDCGNSTAQLATSAIEAIKNEIERK
jgi:hypothetical protein